MIGLTAININNVRNLISIAFITLLFPTIVYAEDLSSKLISFAQSGFTEEVKVLLSKNVNVNSQDKDGWTALMAASSNGHTKIVNILLNTGADVNRGNNFGATALMIATLEGHTNIVISLINKGADVNKLDKNGQTALMGAVGEGHQKIVEILVVNNANINIYSNNGLNPLKLALKHKNNDMISLLIKNGARQSPGFLNPPPYTVKKIQSALSNLGYNTGPQDGLIGENTVDAIRSFQQDSKIAVNGRITEELFDVLDKKQKQPSNKSSTWTLIDKKVIEAENSLNRKGCKKILTHPKYGPICIETFLTSFIVQSVDSLSSKGKKIDVTKSGYEIVEAINREDLTRLKMLLAKGIDFNKNLPESYNEFTPLGFASKEGRLNIVKLLLAEGVDVSAGKKTAFSIALVYKHYKIAEYLLSQNAFKNKTILSYMLVEASGRGDIDIVNTFLTKGVDVNAKGRYGRSALMTASLYGHVDMVKHLLAKGADVNAVDKSGDTALIDASSFGHREIVKILLSNGAEASAVQTGVPGSTPDSDMSTGDVSGSVPPVDEEQIHKATYQAAFNLLRQEGKYDQAKKQFNELINKYPQSNYADNAQYWLGEVNFVQRDFSAALVEFNKVLNNYPDSSKFVDTLLKIGLSQYKLKQWALASDAFKKLIEKYPNSSEARLAKMRLQKIVSEHNTR